MLCPSLPPWLDHSNYTWTRVQVMKRRNKPKHTKGSYKCAWVTTWQNVSSVSLVP
jgi:hypothetical protein